MKTFCRLERFRAEPWFIVLNSTVAPDYLTHSGIRFIRTTERTAGGWWIYTEHAAA